MSKDRREYMREYMREYRKKRKALYQLAENVTPSDDVNSVNRVNRVNAVNSLTVNSVNILEMILEELKRHSALLEEIREGVNQLTQVLTVNSKQEALSKISEEGIGNFFTCSQNSSQSIRGEESSSALTDLTVNSVNNVNTVDNVNVVNTVNTVNSVNNLQTEEVYERAAAEGLKPSAALLTEAKASVNSGKQFDSKTNIIENNIYSLNNSLENNLDLNNKIQLISNDINSFSNSQVNKLTVNSVNNVNSLDQNKVSLLGQANSSSPLVEKSEERENAPRAAMKPVTNSERGDNLERKEFTSDDSLYLTDEGLEKRVLEIIELEKRWLMGENIREDEKEEEITEEEEQEILEEIYELADEDFIDRKPNPLVPPKRERRPGIPYKQIQNMYNRICMMLPRVNVLTPLRKQQIAKNYKLVGGDLNVFQEVFIRVSENPFLTGENSKGWQADFDWIMENFVAIWEGKYDRTPKGINPKLMKIPFADLQKIVKREEDLKYVLRRAKQFVQSNREMPEDLKSQCDEIMSLLGAESIDEAEELLKQAKDAYEFRKANLNMGGGNNVSKR